MTSTRARKLTFTVLSTAILMAVIAALLFATPNGAFAVEPERPTDLVATAVDHDTVSLTWSHPDPASVDHYQVLSRKQGSGAGKLTQVATSTTTSFQHDGLEPESTYIYRVKPVNSAGEQGQRSTRAEATTPADETPAPEPDPTPVPDPTPAQPQRSDEEKQDNVARSSHQVWSATLTVRDSSGVLGCSNGFTGNFCRVHLTDDDFTHDSTDYAINTLWVRTYGRLELELDTTLTTASQALTINIDGTAFGFADADTIGNANRRWNNSGLNWTAGDSISLTITGSTTLSSDTTLSDLELEDNSNTDITLNPTFASATTTYTAQVVNSVDEITITPSVNDSNASYEIQNNAGTPLTDADSAAGFQVDLSVGANIIKVEVTAEDTSTDTYTVTVTRAAATGICGRTAQVRDAIIDAVSGSNCADVTAADLESFYQLYLDGQSITALRAGDFDGMTTLTLLDLGGNTLSTLPNGIFADLILLEELSLGANNLTSLPTGVFNGLTALTTLDLASNNLSALDADVFDELTALETLDLNLNELTTLPTGVFNNLTALTTLDMNDNDLSTLSADVFEKLTALTVLDLAGNELSTLSVDLFDDLTALETLWLNGNDLTTLHVDLFDGLTVMTDLDLSGNALVTLPSAVFEDTTALILLKVADNLITTLPADVFHGLTVLTDLDLSDNDLSTLPDDIFQPLTALVGESALNLSDNPGAPFGPTAVALPDDAIIPTAGDTVTLDGSGSDGGPWGTNVTYLWTLTIPDTGVTVTFDDDTIATTVVTIPALPEGTELTYTLTVSPRDGTAGIAPATDTAKVTATDISTVSISADKTSAVFKEEGITYTLTRTGATTAALPVSITLTQTKNFLLAAELSKTVTILAGQTTKTFNVAASSFQLFAAETPVEGGTLTATVQDGTNYDLGTPSSITIDILIGAMVRIELASSTVAEAAGTLGVKLIGETGPGAPRPSVTTSSLLFSSVDGTAENGIDFGFSSVAASFTSSAFTSNGGVWQAEESFNISITPDDIDEADETFKLQINYQLGHQNTPLVDASGNACDPVAGCEVTVTIVDDDTAGVTVSTSAVAVTEEDTTGDTYTVVLDSQPTATVTITIGGQDAPDITATPTPLTFTTTNWATAQTVTVTAGNDTDTVTDTHSLTHSAASSDAKYSDISITGVAVTVNDNDTANSAPTFSESTYSRSIAENTASDQNVGFAFAATDSDGDTLTYTLEGTDAASFNLITPITAAQIRTKSGVTYNYEVKSTYTVVIKADDGNGGTATATVTITLTDVNEPPGTPSAPSVSGTSGSDTSLTINWSAPTNTGPDINSYDLQYRQGNSGSFTNGPQNVNGLTTTIPNLAASTSYQVQVRATNDEGDSPWSPPGTGSTSSPPVTPPGQVFGVNITPSDQTLQVNWTRVTGATGYKVQWKSGGQSYISSRQATISSGSTTSRAISNLQNETEYTIRVIATKTGASDGTPSADAMGTPTAANTVPTAPKDLNATAVGDTRIDLSWDAPSSTGGSTLTGYKIEVSPNGRSNWTDLVANTNNTNDTHSHTGLSTGDTRHYRVSAINASGTGPHSNIARATTGLPTVSIANATTTEGGDIVFVITISPTIDGFLSVGYGTGIESLPPGSMGARKDADYVPHHPAGADVQIGYGQSSVELTFTTVDDDLVEGTEIFGIGLYPSAYEGTKFSYGTRKAIATIRDDENGGQAYQDSVPGDTSTNQSISPGGSVQNRIETVDDADWYRTTLTENHCYQIKVEGSSADETLTLQYPAVHGVYRSDGTHIMNTYENADGLGAEAIANVKLDTTATYYIAAGLYRFENGGTFRMSLTDLGTSNDSCGAAKPGGPMQISVADATMSESSDRRKYISFIVTLDRRADAEVTVDYTTMNGTAVAGQDYVATSGTLVFEQGEDSKTVYVPIEYDSNDEDDETLTFVLSNARGAQIEDGDAIGTIVDYE